MIDLYKRMICTNCANKDCTNNIKETKTQELTIEQISTSTIVKCKDFVCKNKRKRNPIAMLKW